MKIELLHNEYGGWIMETKTKRGISCQYPATKEDLLKRLRKIIMEQL